MLNSADLYIGLMSGTSGDGIDVSLARSNGDNIFQNIEDYYLEYDKNIKNQLSKLSALSISDIMYIEKKMSLLHVEAVEKILKKTDIKPENVKAIGFHGHTVFHDPSNYITWQMGNPYLLSKKTGINVIADFRRRDMANGGQGAPLVPVFHQYLMKDYNMFPAAIVNIGGVGNLTYYDGKNLLAFDTGPGNAIIDDCMKKYFGKDFDHEGKIASLGKVNFLFVNKLLKDDFFNIINSPKSLDRNYFNNFVKKELNKLSASEIIASLTFFTAITIVNAILKLPSLPKVIFLTGGGVKNKQIINFIKQELEKTSKNIKLKNISAIDGCSADFIESRAFAYLAARYYTKLPSSFTSTTGCKKDSIAGTLF